MDFPMMRYAEILLDYAEAENEAEDTNTAREKAIAQLNRIRRRAGITTDLLAADYNQTSLHSGFGVCLINFKTHDFSLYFDGCRVFCNSFL